MKGTLYMEFVKNFFRKVITLLFYVFRIFPIDKNKIIFTNFNGNGYGDSPKYIAEELIKQDNKKLVWVVKNKHEEIPKKIKKVKIYTIPWVYELVTSKIWLNNTRFPAFVRKRKEQYYIQTWHGGLALKKIEYDSSEILNDYYKKVMINDNKMINLTTSNGIFNTKMYRTAFRYEGDILEYGTPRNDVLINSKESLGNEVHRHYNIQSSEKILLYAPTFRASYESNNPYDIDLKRLQEILQEKYYERWSVIVRLHPNISDMSHELIKNIDEFIDGSTYSDAQELIGGSDLLITDYSSTMFEAMIADKPVILYASDSKDYAKERGYYFKLDELPYPIVTNNSELEKLINTNNLENIKERYDDFKKRVGLKETGQACEMVVKRINEIINNK